tara:strand:+ start:14408 stop:15829 length:1422 start_codon:yes stop_codon:yes gene_type:complete
MKIIVVGAGEVGRHLAEHLSSEAHDTTIVEMSDKLAHDLASLDARIIQGNGSSVDVLLDAGANECDLFMALTSSADVNLVACSVAKELGAKRTICRVHPAAQREEWLFDYRSHFGVDLLFSTELLAAIQLAKFIRNPESMFVEEIARGHIELQQIKISRGSVAENKQLLDLGLPDRVRVGAIQRGEEIVIPTAYEQLVAGDLVMLIGEPRIVHESAGKLGKGVKHESLRVVIFGGGEYGFSLAQLLESWECKVRIMESDPKLCEELTDRLKDTTILNVDATKLSELREERVEAADFFVATSDSDEDNVMACLQARHLGAKECLTLIHRADYAEAISSFGVGVGVKHAVSPREATRIELMRYVTSDIGHTILDIADAEIIEAMIKEECVVAGQKVSDVDWPGGSILIGLLHGANASMPAAGDVIEGGDTIYALVSKQAKKRFFKLLRRKSKVVPGNGKDASEKADAASKEASTG